MLCRIYIDEAGRGPLAGPLFVGSILQIGQLDKNILSKFKDSKILTPNQRKQLFFLIQQLEKQKKVIYSIGFASNEEIDLYGITKSINLAISRNIYYLFLKFYYLILKSYLENSNFGKDLVKSLGIKQIFSQKEINYDDIIKLKNLIFSLNEDIKSIKKEVLEKYMYELIDFKLQSILIDGNTDFNISNDLKLKTTCIIDGDKKVPQISMASIIAKYTRDEYMNYLHITYGNYNFDKHKGYWNKDHIEKIKEYGISKIHRKRFLVNLSKELEKKCNLSTVEKSIVKVINDYKDSFSRDIFSLSNKNSRQVPILNYTKSILVFAHKFAKKIEKPGLLIHICCAPDLAWPLRWLKKYFKLYLFWYNPNIHPYIEYKRRYDQYIKLLKLEPGDFEILPDWYNPKEFFDYLKKEYKLKYNELNEKNILYNLKNMEEKNSDRCWWCYDLRLIEAAKTAQKYNIPYFTTTLLISPKKDMTHLFLSGIKAQNFINNESKFLFFDFKLGGGYEKAAKIVKDYNLRRQNYCGCIWTVKE